MLFQTTHNKFFYVLECEKGLIFIIIKESFFADFYEVQYSMKRKYIYFFIFIALFLIYIGI